MIERQIEIPSQDGRITTFITHPERGGPHPVLLFYMDAPGIREELRDMARRLAAVGYYVVLPNLYHRSNVLELGPIPQDPASDERKQLFERVFALMASIDIAKVMADTDALLAFVDADPAASKGPLGTVGYCMSGRYAISAAARYPDRVAAAASIYGTQLMTDQPDSPHLAARRARAEFYIACAEIDHYVPLETVAPLRASLQEAGVAAEVELYPAVEHGFAFPQRAAFNKEAAERHWERLFALYRRRLTP
ncbi:dienelactone hydrolase family protein [Bradyrhizobium sp. U87765 SZCCT0131]|uniref:dienelactone hydrolase family protein n=1 Tax=unclassified Bradyrhizobium TaxID=2631580 RepID=UPI001BAD7455|nr:MULTISPECIES: dienelactone hydrolase family protein [unclassified Bradyrhizobium]MBR1218648.1 dienelactone hydrolase family protein [Bradyrhizobium sp. U87765 SZCCT0131]MBR1265593.1 dienelactone hydrolase family protein [Bradyrhizobium sp. U87765 SZCCT0134]MBR1304146.1 dienelactone hydrolase family protein [Bradyrhizobium sp. U87765 SZCCT0110]MBR1319752.1 dienelactone hydrolase family protein [Bradyrhizobium sp. U87765 SZCCT0109]MBR1348077.1 dienelactone hydrolase family protein [Bradyrhizo